MIERTTHERNARRHPPSGGRAVGTFLLPPMLAALLVVGCSGGSSGDSDQEDAGEKTVVDDEPQPATVDHDRDGTDDEAGDRASDGINGAVGDRLGDGSGDEDDDGDGAPSGSSDESRGAPADEPFDPGALTKRLDRLVAGTDAHILRFGLEAEAAAPLLLFDVLEGHLKSAQARLRGIAAPAGEGRE